MRSSSSGASFRWIAGATLLLTFLGACAPSAPPDTRRGEILRVAAPEVSFGTAEVGFAQFTRFFTHEGLTGLSQQGRAVPRLAESWSWAEGGLKLRIRLRSGVHSHSGVLTSAMVADALRAAVSSRVNRPQYWSLGHVTSVDATGDTEVTISLDRPTGALPEDLDLPLGFGTANAGTGPFRLAGQSDAESELERFPN